MAAGIEIVGRKIGTVLAPYGEAAERDFESVPQGRSLLVTLEQRRNPDHHAKLFAILQRVCDFTDEFDTPEDVLLWLKLRLKMVKGFKDWDGRVLFHTQSVSFASMDQLRFSRFWDRAMWVLSEYLGFDPEELLPPRRKEAA